MIAVLSDPLPADLSALQAFIPHMVGKNVLVIGDIMLDRFVYGEAHRISPESPVPVLSVRRETIMLGGAGNVLSNMHGLGVQAHVVAVLGDDDEAAQVRQLVAECRADPATLLAANDRPTTVKTRFLAANQQLLRTDYERVAPVSEGLENALVKTILSLAPGMQAIILSDYGKGVLTKAVIAAAMQAAHKAGIPVLVDPKAKDYAIYKGADIVTPNRKELSEAVGMPTATDEDVIAASRELMTSSGIRAVVATRSQDGMTISHGRGPTVHLKTEALEVFDVSGAGDTVIATIAAALAAGANLYEAAAIANFAAGVVVGKVGTAPIRRDELMSAMARGDKAIVKTGTIQYDRVRQAPLSNWDDAAEQVARWRARGLKVGFTNGCFDILHAGHVTYLNMARARCDRLVVAINCDESVRRLKGETRPVNDEIARARVLGALGSVDLVILFGGSSAEDDKPEMLIRKLTPDLLVKGGDYTPETVVGADYVMSTGGEVWIAPLEEGKSTSGTIAKLKGAA